MLLNIYDINLQFLVVWGTLIFILLTAVCTLCLSRQDLPVRDPVSGASAAEEPRAGDGVHWEGRLVSGRREEGGVRREEGGVSGRMERGRSEWEEGEREE